MTTDNRYLLLVDDDDIVHFLAQLTLRDLDYDGEVVIASDGVEACDVLNELGQPLLMLLDLRMPCMDGHEVLEALRRGDFGTPPPTVIVSSSFRPEDLALVDSYCFVEGYVEKPLKAEDMQALARTRTTLSDVFALN